MNPRSVNNFSGSHTVPNGFQRPALWVAVDGKIMEAIPGERLLELLNRSGTEIPQVCYHPQLGPIQTCDTCIVENSRRGLFFFGSILEAFGRNLPPPVSRRETIIG